MSPSVGKAMGYLPLSEAQYNLVASVIADGIGGGENLDDVLVGSAYLGGMRASLLGRIGIPEDLAFALSLFTWWPFKPGPPTDVETQLRELRVYAFRGASDVESLVDASDHPLNFVVPESTLRLPIWELYAKQQEGVAFLAVQEAR